MAHKRAKSKRLLEEKLFILDDIFRPKILNHRQYCNEMQKMRFVEVAKGIQCMSIDEFAGV